MTYKTCCYLAVAATICAPSLGRAQAQFEDVSSQSGISYEGESWGASWGDLNGDRFPDLFASNHRNPPGVYLNLGDQTFSDVALVLSDAWIDPDKPFPDSHGAAWADFDNDGDLDLYVSAGGSDPNEFLVNDDGFLTNRTLEYDPGLPQWRARLPVWFDFTGDGKLDFFMAGESSALVFEQTGSGFVDRSAESGFSCDSSQYAVLANVVGGGELEFICVTSLFPKNAYEFPGIPFSSVTSALPQTSPVLDVALADFDGDLTTDVFMLKGNQRLSGALQVGNSGVETQLIALSNSQKGVAFNSGGDITVNLAVDWKLSSNDIFIGAEGLHPLEPLTGKHTITLTLSADDADVRGIAGHIPSRDKGVYIGFDPVTQKWQLFNSPGGTWAYVYASIVSTAPVSNISSINLASGDQPTAPTLLLHNTGNFTNATQASGLGSPISCISPAAGDFDNDMDVDLYLVCRGAIANLENRLYENQGDGTFVMTPSGGGAAGPTGFGFGTGENVVVADYDVDGFLDLFVTNGLQLVPIGPGGPSLLFHNLGAGINHWLELDLAGTVSNRDGIGARVFLSTPDGKTQLREQNGGYHRWAQHSQRIHFGLGENANADVTVEWPSGTVDVFPAVSGDKLYRVVEGGPMEPLVPGEIPPPIVALSISDVSVAEDGGDANFSVRLSPPSDQTVFVDLATGDGSGVTPDDYAEMNGTLSFAPGEIEKTVAVPIIDDALIEGDETFTVTLSNAMNASLGRSVGIGTIIDNEASTCGLPVYNAATEQAVFIAQDCATGDWRIRVTAGGSSASFRGSVRSEQPFDSITPFSLEASDTVDATTDPRAIDYILNVGSTGQDGFNFGAPAGTAVCVSVDMPVGASILVGANRTPVSAPFDLETRQPCVVPPELPKLSINSVMASESDGPASFMVTLTAASDDTVTVNYASADETAVSPDDYVPVSGSLTFAPGQLTMAVPVSIVDDALTEGSETFTVALSNAANASLGVSSTGTGTIIDDDGPATPPCGLPAYNKATERGVFIGRDCATDSWLVRMSSGGSSVSYRGAVESSQPFSSVTGFSIEASDTLNFTTVPTRITYVLKIGPNNHDGFDFDLPAGAKACFGLTSPTSLPVVVGPDRIPVPLSFDLETLEACQ